MSSTDSANRLHRTVERLLDRITETSRQLHDAQRTQTDMVLVLEQRSRAVDELSSRCEELESQLKEELQNREHLAMEFYKAEGKLIVFGFVSSYIESDKVVPRFTF